LYGAETWRLAESNKRRIEATEMDALRRLPEYQEKIKLEIQPLDNKLEKLNQL
jgi:hypothetical protein